MEPIGNPRITESPSRYDHLEQMTTLELLRNINAEDRKVADAVAQAIPAMEPLVNALADRMQRGGGCSMSVQAPVGGLVSWMPANVRPRSVFHMAWSWARRLRG